MIFPVELDNFVDKLVHIQQHIRDKKEYRRSDQHLVNKYLEEIENFRINHFMVKEKTSLRFWELYRAKIRMIMPSIHYKGFNSLLQKFEDLDDYAKTRIWKSVTEKLV